MRKYKPCAMKMLLHSLLLLYHLVHHEKSYKRSLGESFKT